MISGPEKLINEYKFGEILDFEAFQILNKGLNMHLFFILKKFLKYLNFSFPPHPKTDKYLVFVSYESDDSGTDHWESNKISPGKDELLYKRVITYQVPPFEPNRNLISPVQATLHLECPQSNQYCSIGFQYVPEGGWCLYMFCNLLD